MLACRAETVCFAYDTRLADSAYMSRYWIADGIKLKDKPRVTKGCQSSCTAYMLVYRLRSLATGLHSSAYGLHYSAMRLRID